MWVGLLELRVACCDGGLVEALEDGYLHREYYRYSNHRDVDGVLIASPEEAREHLAFVQEKEAWEEWVRGEITKGLTISHCRAQRPDPMTKVTIGTMNR